MNFTTNTCIRYDVKQCKFLRIGHGSILMNILKSNVFTNTKSTDCEKYKTVNYWDNFGDQSVYVSRLLTNCLLWLNSFKF